MSEAAGPKADQAARGKQGLIRYVMFLFKGDRGDRGDRGTRGDRGPQGDQGPRGPQGKHGLPPGVRYAVVSLCLLTFLLAAASYWLSVRAVQGEIRNRVSVVQLCQSGNEARAQQVTLWTHIIAISAPPPHETAAQKQQRQVLVARFLAYVRQVFAPRNCIANFKG